MQMNFLAAVILYIWPTTLQNMDLQSQNNNRLKPRDSVQLV